MTNPQTTQFLIRPATFADFANVYRLIAQQNIADFGEALLSPDDLHERWQDAEHLLAKHSRVAFSLDSQLLGYAVIRPYAPQKSLAQLYLSPTPSLVELGKLLLTELETDLPPQSQVIAQISGKNEQNQKIFAAAGYEPGLTFLMMEIELTEPPPEPVWPEGIAIRPFQSNQDEQTTYAVDEEASLDKGYSNPMSFTEWAKRMSLHTERFDPTLWLLACRNEEVVGVSLNFYLPERNYGLIDHLGVRRAWRGMGIGLALLQQSFAIFFARGITKIKLNVDSGSLTNAPRLYEKAGMHTVQAYQIFSKTII